MNATEDQHQSSDLAHGAGSIHDVRIHFAPPTSRSPFAIWREMIKCARHTVDFRIACRVVAQEAFELYLKSVFRYFQAEYPKVHDVKKEIYALTTAFKQHEIEPHQVEGHQLARLVLANSVLQVWREPAFYGDETLNVGGLFEESEAKLALWRVASLRALLSRLTSSTARQTSVSLCHRPRRSARSGSAGPGAQREDD